MYTGKAESNSVFETGNFSFLSVKILDLKYLQSSVTSIIGN